MKRCGVLMLLSLLCWMTSGAQQRFVVVSTENGVPLSDILIYTDDGQELTTSWTGEAELNAGYATVTLAHPGFVKRIMTAAEVDTTDTVQLIPNMQRLHEVIVYGYMPSMTQRIGPLMSKVDLELVQATPQGFNPLGLLFWGVDKLVLKRVRHRKAMERQRRQMIIDNY